MAKTFTKLTRPDMRKLAPGRKINEHGITFERSATGDGVFTVNIMADGQRIHRVVGRESDGTTRTQAEAFIEKVRSDAKNDRLALPKGRKVALAMHEAATKYLERLKAESFGKARPDRSSVGSAEVALESALLPGNNDHGANAGRASLASLGFRDSA